MSSPTLDDLQVSIRDRSAFLALGDFFELGAAFLKYLAAAQPTRIISPSHSAYIFYQFDAAHHHRITRPLNSHLWIEVLSTFQEVSARFVSFLADLRRHQHRVVEQPGIPAYLASGEINGVVYTVQQAIGSVSDSFDNPNQSRKRVGQLWERLITLLVREVGLICEPRTVNIPIPGADDHFMPYQLDLVFSRNKALLTSETSFIYPHEVVGSVKTTSKDRLDKIFLDKYLLSHLLGRDVPVVAIFLHDVQRATRANSIFGVASTFKSNHFLGYTVALNRLDGVYYVDPRPEMVTNERLRTQIRSFQQFLVQDLWALSSP